MKATVFTFKTHIDYFWKEQSGVKNNTVRKIDLNDDRFLDLIAWAVDGWNDGDIQIKICDSSNPNSFFIRNIRDISIWNDLMVITWHHNIKERYKVGSKLLWKKQ